VFGVWCQHVCFVRLVLLDGFSGVRCLFEITIVPLF